MDNVFKHLREYGVGVDSKHTESISLEEENLLWVLNIDTAQGQVFLSTRWTGAQTAFCV